jgi:PAS domain S-box-containing protein
MRLNLRPFARYALAVGAVGCSVLLYRVLTAWLGPGLPTYITFYPAVMVVALLGGFGPGLLATGLAGMAADFWILEPAGLFSVGSLRDGVGLGLFSCMGVFMSAVAELYRRNRDKAAAYGKELALREANREKEFFAELLEHADQPFAVGYPDGRIGRLNRAYERLTGYTAAELRALDWAAALTPPEWRGQEQQKLEELQRTGGPVRYKKEYLRKDGSRVPVELLVHVARDAAGKPDYYYAFLTDITERKQAEETLREREERLRFHVENTGLAVIEWDAQFVVTRWAGQAEPMFGWRSAEVVGKTLGELGMVYEADLPIVQEVMAKLTDGVTRQVVSSNRNYAKDGRVIHCTWHNSVLLDGAGRVASVLSLVQDFTARFEAEAALRASEERYRLLVDQTVDGIFVSDPQGRYLDVNRAGAAMLGYTPEEILHLRIPEVIHPDEVPRLTPEIGKFAGGQVVRSEWRFRRKDGSCFTGEVMGRQLPDGRLQAILRDVTERRRAEEALAQSEAKLRQQFEELRQIYRYSPVGLFVMDRDLRFLGLNERLAQINGRTVQEHMGRTLGEVLPGLAEPLGGICRTVIATGTPALDLEIQGSTPKEPGVTRHWLASYFPLKSETGEVTRLMGAVMEITDRKRAEAALQQIAQDLARSNRDLEQFAYVASHDLQEPLRAVAGYVQLLQQHLAAELDDKALHYIASATEGAARMQTLIHDLLAFSRVGTQGMAIARTDLNTVLDEVLANLQPRLRDTGARVTADSLPTLQVDRTQMLLLLQNLIGNALKFRREAPPEVHLAARKEAGGWRITVRDNGLGIEPQYFEKIFLIFQRLHTRKQYPGTGIGLAICKKIVERHGGTIGVESQPGHGSTFYFTITDPPPT